MTKKGKHNNIELSTPWGSTQITSSARIIHGNVNSQSGYFKDDKENTELFIKERSRVHELYIKEQEKTKRVSLVLAVVLVIISVILLIFAPKGKETLSYIVCGVLFVFAAGAVGYKRIWGKVKIVEFKADSSD